MNAVTECGIMTIPSPAKVSNLKDNTDKRFNFEESWDSFKDPGYPLSQDEIDHRSVKQLDTLVPVLGESSA